jgi:predicted transglutaminase-like cysteine proteinase
MEKENIGVFHLTILGIVNDEDYAIAKKQALLSHDIESKFATCWTETGGYHAVLIVATDYGDFVLDNRYNDVKHFDDLPYSWHKIEGEDSKWYAIS